MNEYVMTRIGKIARLPQPIREQLNRRLQDGEQGKESIDDELASGTLTGSGQPSRADQAVGTRARRGTAKGHGWSSQVKPSQTESNLRGRSVGLDESSDPVRPGQAQSRPVKPNQGNGVEGMKAE